MKQTDQFGRFNALIREYGSISQEMIVFAADKARYNLLAVSDPSREWCDVEGYVDVVVESYRVLYRMVQKPVFEKPLTLQECLNEFRPVGTDSWGEDQWRLAVHQHLHRSDFAGIRVPYLVLDCDGRFFCRVAGRNTQGVTEYGKYDSGRF